MAYEVDLDFSKNTVGPKTLAVREGRAVVARFTVRDGSFGRCRDEADAFAREHNARLPQEPVPAPEPREWAVNVRAIVTLTQVSNSAGDYGDAFEGWDVYDDEAGQEPDTRVVRCDRIVRVTATTKEDAIERAQAEAPGIPIPTGFEGEVSLWVDEGIDVDPDHAEEAAPAPGM